METYMMFGQEYKKNASHVTKNFNKKKLPLDNTDCTNISSNKLLFNTCEHDKGKNIRRP